MIAFKNLLIFLIIFIYQTTGNDQLKSELYNIKVKGNITCSDIDDKGKQVFLAISTNNHESIPNKDYLPERKFVNYGRNFTIEGKFDKIKVQKLYLIIRHSCLLPNDKSKGCNFRKITAVNIPLNKYVNKTNKNFYLWKPGNLDLSKTIDDSTDSCL
uniref:Uncharacterized protein n=1 Tax=Strongyloides papillosus TaxID=174720 RepID=A0A0N5BHP5_STREA